MCVFSIWAETDSILRWHLVMRAPSFTQVQHLLASVPSFLRCSCQKDVMATFVNHIFMLVSISTWHMVVINNVFQWVVLRLWWTDGSNGICLCVAGAGGNQSPGERDGGRGREAEGATERGGETDESQPPTRCVWVSRFLWSKDLSSHLSTFRISLSIKLYNKERTPW